MAKIGFGCERKECGSSTGITGEITFGTGKLDHLGYWEYPCEECKKSWIGIFGTTYSITTRFEQMNLITA
jgi:hypothetical protein